MFPPPLAFSLSLAPNLVPTLLGDHCPPPPDHVSLSLVQIPKESHFLNHQCCLLLGQVHPWSSQLWLLGGALRQVHLPRSAFQGGLWVSCPWPLPRPFLHTPIPWHPTASTRSALLRVFSGCLTEKVRCSGGCPLKTLNQWLGVGK